MIDFAFLYTLVLIFGMTLFLVKEVFEPDVIVFTVLLLLILGGIITTEEAFSGFANEGMLTVAFLFIVAGTLQKTGVLNTLADKFFSSDCSFSLNLLRLMLPVSAFSAFFNNTRIVAMFIPVIPHWTTRNGQAASKFMIPLSYAAILGGFCTLIGTSTILVLHGLMKQNGLGGFGFFEITPVGVPVALAGIFIVASLYTEIITKNAAAALVFPVAHAMTQQAHVDPRPFCITLASAASAGFATPIGYQTNTMVYGPGGYHFIDYLKTGIPLNILTGLITVSLVYAIYF